MGALRGTAPRLGTADAPRSPRPEGLAADPRPLGQVQQRGAVRRPHPPRGADYVGRRIRGPGRRAAAAAGPVALRPHVRRVGGRQQSCPTRCGVRCPSTPRCSQCLELMISRLPGDTWHTGPGVLTDVLPLRRDVLLLPPGSFYPVHYRDPDRDMKYDRLVRQVADRGRSPSITTGAVGSRKNGDGYRRERLQPHLPGNEWNGIETRSGPGSHREPTRRVADAIVQLVDWLDIVAVTQLGCGEDWWMPDLPGYLGVDVAPEAIEAARAEPPRPRHTRCGRIDAPCRPSTGDLPRRHPAPVVCADGMRLLDAILRTWPTYLLASTYVGADNERHRQTVMPTARTSKPSRSTCRPPLLLIHDGYEYHDGDRLRDPAKMLGLWRL